MPSVDTPEFRDGENLLLAPAGDVEALADSVVWAATDPGLQASLEAGARTLAEAFTWKAIATRTAAFFAELIA